MWKATADVGQAGGALTSSLDGQPHHVLPSGLPGPRRLVGLPSFLAVSLSHLINAPAFPPHISIRCKHSLYESFNNVL